MTKFDQGDSSNTDNNEAEDSGFMESESISGKVSRFRVVGKTSFRTQTQSFQAQSQLSF